MSSVTINALSLENVKRVKAVELTPTQSGLTVIGGRNAQGKTSILDAIAWALGGNKKKPDSPNRDGSLEPASIHIELSNGLVVERKGKTGALRVTDSRGLKGGQALLDEFVGQLAIDLPKFLQATDKERANYLLGIIGVADELIQYDARIRSLFDERRDANRDADRQRKAADVMPYYPEAPESFIDVSELMDEIQCIMDRNADNANMRNRLAGNMREIEDRRADIDEFTRQIEALTAQRNCMDAELASLMESTRLLKEDVDRLQDGDVSPIKAQVANANAINQQVQANRTKAQAVENADRAKAVCDDLTKRLDECRAQRLALLEGANMPLEGLNVQDGALYYNGHVWSDMSGAEQLRVATAIVRATKPECGFVLVDKLEQFDTQQLAEFAAWAEGEGLQVIGTRVATDDSCTVIIEDGMVV